MDKLLCLFFCASVGHLLQIDATDVQWPSGYSVEWSMREESSGFSMNVKQYTSKSKNAFRWDVFGGENTFIIKQNDQNVSELYYYFLTTNETSTNVMYCFFEPSIFDTIDNSGLPDPKGFSRSETVTVNGAQLQKWTFTSSFGESKREYTLWINMGTETEGPIPVKAHYQEYVGGTQEELFSATRLTVDYYNYIPKEPEESVWDGPKNIECLADYGAYNDTMMGFMGNAIVPVALRSSITSVSPVEKKGKGLKINRPSGSSALPFPYTDEEVQAMAANLPKSFDWRKHGAVTEVKNQMYCGSCWIFGAIGSLEGAYFIKTGNLLVLSEQALMDCCWKLNFEDQNHTVGGCQGGFTEPAMDCIKHYGGVPMTVDYGNYKEINGRCSMSGMKLVAPIKSFVHVAQNKDAVKVALYHHGPLAVSIATPWQFEYYVNGVISADNPGPIDHTVLLVGYGTLDGVDYWTIKNSWGEGWGLRGFGLISAANDNLSLLDDVYYPVLE